MAVHVPYNSLYISLQNNNVNWPILRCLETTANFLKFYFKFTAVSQIQFRDNFDSDKQSKWLKSILSLEGKI